MTALHALLAVFGVALLIPTMVVSVQVVFSMPRVRPREMPGGPRPRIAVLVPAYDEALIIEPTLRALRGELGPGDRLVVVADNCSDETAKIARATGAEVVERIDRQLRGKGYALDHGVQFLGQDPPEVLVVIDADCDVAIRSIERIARVCRETARPVQALYRMRSPRNAGVGSKLAEFAWLIKNYARPLGSHRMGIPCQLMGTGMAFPWASLSRTSLATGHIAEDVLFGINLARAGTPPLFCPEAEVGSELAASKAGAHSQRRRWVHGNLSLLFSEAPRLFLRGLACGDLRLLGMALDLAVPPVSLLVLLLSALVFLASLFKYFGGGSVPMWIGLTALALLISAIALSWARYGRRVISLWHLALAPGYALGKIPLYLDFLTKRQAEWVRTRRDS